MIPIGPLGAVPKGVVSFSNTNLWASASNSTTDSLVYLSTSANVFAFDNPSSITTYSSIINSETLSPITGAPISVTTEGTSASNYQAAAEIGSILITPLAPISNFIIDLAFTLTVSQSIGTINAYINKAGSPICSGQCNSGLGVPAFSTMSCTPSTEISSSSQTPFTIDICAYKTSTGTVSVGLPLDGMIVDEVVTYPSETLNNLMFNLPASAVSPILTIPISASTSTCIIGKASFIDSSGSSSNCIAFNLCVERAASGAPIISNNTVTYFSNTDSCALLFAVSSDSLIMNGANYSSVSMVVGLNYEVIT